MIEEREIRTDLIERARLMSRILLAQVKAENPEALAEIDRIVGQGGDLQVSINLGSCDVGLSLHQGEKAVFIAGATGDDDQGGLH